MDERQYDPGPIPFPEDSNRIVAYALKLEGGQLIPTSVSAAVEEILDHSRGSMIGNPNWWAENLHPDDREAAFSKAGELFSDGIIDHKYRFRRRDGHYIWVRDRLQVSATKDGQPTEFVGSWVDITYEIEVREKTVSVNQLLFNAIQGLTEIFALWDADDRLVTCNQLFREINHPFSDLILPGASFEKLTRAGLRVNAFPEAVGREEDWLEERLERHRNPSDPIEVQRQDGVWLLVQEQRLPDGNTVLISTDISRQKQIEHDLRLAREGLRTEVDERTSELRTIINNLPASIALIGADGRIRLANSRLAGRYRHTPEEMVGKHAIEILPDTSRASIEPQMHAALSGQRVEFESPIIFPNGEQQTIHVTYLPFQQKNEKATGFLALSVDVTEQKKAQETLHESEQRYRAAATQMQLITDSLPVLINYIDSNQIFRFVNRTAEEWYERPREEILGKTVSELLGADYEKFRPSIEKVLAGDPVEIVLDHRYGTETPRYVHVFYVPDFSDDGTVRGYFALSEDQTERRNTEQLLQQSQKMETIGQLTGGLAHDFNNLLTVILGNLDLLGDRVEGDEIANRFIATAVRAGQRGAELNNRLLTFARRQDLHVERINIDHLINETHSLLDHTIRSDITISTDISPDIWPVRSDATQLQSALVNLALNARDAMPNGGNLILSARNKSIDAEQASHLLDAEPGDYTEIAVSDNGTGMPPEVRERILEPFFTTKQIGKGTGLGLSMVYGLVKQSEGFLEVDSVEGMGTTVRIFLPRATSENTSEVIEPDDPEANLPVGSETILIVDDEPEIRNFAATVLSTLGYATYSSKNGAEAVAIMHELDHIDLLLTDVIMDGEISGTEAADIFTTLHPGKPVLFISGYSRDELIAKYRQSGDPKLLAKPFGRPELARRVRQILDEESAQT